MPLEPPQVLVDLLGQLRLATRDQVRGVASQVRRRAGDTPDFESLWIDALVRARILTPLQAARIRDGDGDSLCVDSYVVCEPLGSVCYAVCYRARHVESGKAARL